MLTFRDAYNSLRDALNLVYDRGEAEAIAQNAMTHITGQSKLQRLSAPEEKLSVEKLEQYQQIKSQLRWGKPWQYITGEAFFMGHKFFVDDSVLIPRPETEELVQWIVDDYRGQSPAILDIGTGSGVIAISLKHALWDANLSALDVSDKALGMARINAQSQNAFVDFIEADILEAATRKALPVFDVIVSNPPYIPFNERESLHANVRDYEPELALFVPENDPLLFYRVIADLGKAHLAENGSIYCELHRDFAQASAELFRTAGYKDVELRNDMFDAPRMLRARA